MRHLTYLALLLACLLGTLPLELVLGARVYRQWRRAVRAILPVAVLFALWDVVAVQAKWWSFDRRHVIGWFVPGGLPVEELMFFLVIPLCGVLTLEAVRRIRPDWRVDDADGREDT